MADLVIGIGHRLSNRLLGLALGVESFFVLSGAVILLAPVDEVGKAASFRSYMRKRARRVYPIYWSVLAFVVLAHWPRTCMGGPFTDRALAQRSHFNEPMLLACRPEFSQVSGFPGDSLGLIK